MPVPVGQSDQSAIAQNRDSDRDGVVGCGGVSASEGRDPEDEDEEEPRLKYQRLGSDVAGILARDEASCLCVSDKMLVLGTHNGSVHLLSCAGDEVRGSRPLTGASDVWSRCGVSLSGPGSCLGA